MFIRSVQLEEIKSHKESSFEFRKGTTAIIGENGAGKTTVIEAVAWTLFDLLDYKKDAFLRRGAKRGTARVTFESELDERTYVVHRDTGTGYYVYDPAIKTRVADKKEEVQRFLRQHMGVEPGTDLETLFRSAIGVPQGTFTSIFLETPAARKREFDKLLKVEEYRQSSDRLIDTVNHVKSLVRETETRIAFAKGKLENYDEVRKEHKAISAEEKKLASELEKQSKKAEKLRAQVAKFEAIESEISGIRDELDRASERLTKAKVSAGTLEAEVKNATEAAEKLNASRPGHEEHLKALGMLKELERERTERDRLNKEISEVEQALAKVRSDKERYEADLEKALNAHRRIEDLKPKAEEQKRLEKKREELRNALAEARSAAARFGSIERDVKGLRDRYREVQADLKAAETAREEAAKLPALLKEDDKLRESIADLKGRLENDRRFQSEVKNGLCPILSEKCLNLKEGETLDGYLSSQFSELTKKISAAEAERKELSGAVAAARKAETAAARYEPLKGSADEITERGKALNEEKQKLEASIANEKKLSEDLVRTEASLRDLGNPEAAMKLLSEESGNEISIREMLTKTDSNLERLESERRLKVEQLDSYKDLEFNLRKYSESRDATTADHNAFLANKEQAEKLEGLNASLKEAKTALDAVEKERETLEKRMTKASKDFDREKYASEKDELVELEKAGAAVKANLDNASKRRKELSLQVEELEKHRATLKEDEAENKRLEEVLKTTTFIRNTLKEAAPRVAQNYVHHVSIEANQMFRDITGNAEHTLKWDDDYGIAVEEGGFDRPFQNLSGGEQMAAALSVRLALLKQLSDISLAFFDEPTTNLDLERRERLAEQISRITESGTFDQLFVVSHDDTFEGYVDNVLTIDPGEFEQG